MDKIKEINQAIYRYYSQNPQGSEDLIVSILYSVESGGKRIRPLLFLEMLEGFGMDLRLSS